MPIVLCKYCEYVGQGDTPSKQWRDAYDHETKEHAKEIYEEGR